MTKQEKLEHIYSELQKVSVYEGANFVPGEGNPDAAILFIGEAPGKNEDEQKRPFVGAAGKFLQEMLETINLKRSDVFITNIVKQRPPNNRDPLPEEIAAHQPFLEQQIVVIDPTLIVLLGRHSMQLLLPGLGTISQLHGKAFRRKDGRMYMPLYHPAAALYNGGLRQTLLDDFRKIPALLKKAAEGSTA